MADEEKKLQMSFDLNTIDHLGIKMYSYIPNAMAELIANAYDAKAKNVYVKLYDNDDEKRIEVSDDGIGMDFDEVNDKFLRIGRNRREDDAIIGDSQRKPTGKKGLGKLALFGLGDLIEVTTTKEGSNQKLKFILSLTALKGTTKGKDYEPTFSTEDCSPEEQGTSIILRNLNRKSSFNTEELAVSLSRLFDCFSEGFRCFITLNDTDEFEVDNKLKFKDIPEQFIWEFPGFSEKMESAYENKEKIIGRIISTETPLRSTPKGITLFANGRLVNAPEFFGRYDSSHVFSYLTGWLNVDFIDDINEDVISTNRQSLNWDLQITEELRQFLYLVLGKIIADWRDKRTEKKEKAIKDETGIDTKKWQENLPPEIKGPVKMIIDNSAKNNATPTKEHIELVTNLHDLAPEYPYYHWRHLHDEIRNVAKAPYEKEEYYKAIEEAIKRYVRAVRIKSGNLPDKDHPLMGRAFGFENGMPKLLSVTKIYKRPDGSDFSPETIENIENGHRELSQGIVRGCRNPLAHEEDIDLRGSGLFSEKDCLDALSLLSHLFRRLENAEKI